MEQNNEKETKRKINYVAFGLGVVAGILLGLNIYFITSNAEKKNEVINLQLKLETKTAELNACNTDLTSALARENTIKGDLEVSEAQREQLGTQITNLTTQKATLEGEVTTLQTQLAAANQAAGLCTVIYSANDTTVKMFSVNKGGSVKTTDIPAVPNKDGYTGEWKTAASNVTSDMIIYPNYTPKTFNINVELGYIHTNDAMTWVFYDLGDSSLMIDKAGKSISEYKKVAVTNGEFTYEGKSYKFDDDFEKVNNVTDSTSRYRESIENYCLHDGKYGYLTCDHNYIYVDLEKYGTWSENYGRIENGPSKDWVVLSDDMQTLKKGQFLQENQVYTLSHISIFTPEVDGYNWIDVMPNENKVKGVKFVDDNDTIKETKRFEATSDYKHFALPIPYVESGVMVNHTVEYFFDMNNFGYLLESWNRCELKQGVSIFQSSYVYGDDVFCEVDANFNGNFTKTVNGHVLCADQVDMGVGCDIEGVFYTSATNVLNVQQQRLIKPYGDITVYFEFDYPNS